MFEKILNFAHSSLLTQESAADRNNFDAIEADSDILESIDFQLIARPSNLTGWNAMKRQALIVDDSPDLRDLLSQALSNEGLAVVTAVDGLDAIDKLKDMSEPCVILLDLMMPRMDGFQFLEWKVKHQVPYPVIVLSASTVKTVLSGASLYLKKPVDLDELLSAIDTYCPDDPKT